MIKFTRTVTRNIDEKALFENLKEYLFEEEIFDEIHDYIDTVENLPKDVQRIIFARMGAMMINFAESENF